MAKVKKDTPRNVVKMSITDKKRFVDLFNEGAESNAYFAYLALNQTDVAFLKDNIDSLKKEIAVWEKEKAENLKKAQAEAARLNDLAKANGTFVDNAKKGKLEWTVPPGQEGAFLKDAARRTIEYMMKNWHNNKQAIINEIMRLEKK